MENTISIEQKHGVWIS